MKILADYRYWWYNIYIKNIVYEYTDITHFIGSNDALSKKYITNFEDYSVLNSFQLKTSNISNGKDFIWTEGILS